jgi:hypothetical protein
VGVAEVVAVAAVEEVLSCNDELVLTLEKFEDEILIEDADDRSEECDTLDSLEDYKTCLDSFTTTVLVNQDNIPLTEYVTCYKKCYTPEAEEAEEAGETAGSKLLLTLTFLSMLIAFVTL